jgi:transposase
MLSIPGALKIYLAIEPTDMRKSHDGLAALAEHTLQLDPLSGALFVFRNKRGDRVKLLYWDIDGYALWYKRLEVGAFKFPKADDGAQRVAVSAADLTMLLDGVDLSSVKRTKRYHRATVVAAETVAKRG